MKQYDALSMELMEGWLDSGLAFHLRSRFAMHGPDAARRSALRFLQLEQGERIAGEVAMQETMLVVLDGEVEIGAGGERHTGDRGSVAVIAPYTPWSVHNAARRPAHLLCLLPQAAIDSVFVAPLKPLRIRTNASGSAQTTPMAS